MELHRKLMLCVAFSFIAVIIKIIVFAGPGWTVVKTHVTAGSISVGISDVPEVWDHHYRSRYDVSIYFGMWYYKVCMYDDGWEGIRKRNRQSDRTFSKECSCYYRLYLKRSHEQRIDFVGEDREHAMREDKAFENGIPDRFRIASSFISTSVELARHGQYELAAYVTIGLILGFIGMISSVLYARTGGLGKHSGRLACSTQVLSCFCYWMAVIRVATIIVELRLAQKHDMLLDSMGKEVLFPVPWCVVLGAIGAVIMGIAALFHLIMISRDRKTKIAEYAFHTQNASDVKIPTLVPNGYEQLAVPPIYKADEANPIPQKQPIT